jgi:5-methylcytosine-specific restriction endonuclease McrBC regulatory subunit McrC
VFPDADVQEEPAFTDRQGKLRPDLFIKEGKETAVVEVKRYKVWLQREQQSALEQMHRYLETSGADSAFLVAVPGPQVKPSEGHSMNKLQPT